MCIAENGPNIVHADKLLKSALDSYWNEMSRDGAWHFCHKSEDIRSFGAPSKTVQKHFKNAAKTYILFTRKYRYLAGNFIFFILSSQEMGKNIAP